MNKNITLRIPSEHPCIDGHFPGNPIIPGAYLLSLVSLHCEQSLNEQVEQISKVKFAQAAKPEATLTLTLTTNQEKRLTFSIHEGDQLLASGKGLLR